MAFLLVYEESADYTPNIITGNRKHLISFGSNVYTIRKRHIPEYVHNVYFSKWLSAWGKWNSKNMLPLSKGWAEHNNKTIKIFNLFDTIKVTKEKEDREKELKISRK